jgi:hypothetical protein
MTESVSGGVGVIRRAASKDEAAIAIAALDKALFVDLEEHARMAQRGAGRDVGRPVAHDAAMGDSEGFGLVRHGGSE